MYFLSSRLEDVLQELGAKRRAPFLFWILPIAPFGRFGLNTGRSPLRYELLQNIFQARALKIRESRAEGRHLLLR